MNVRGAMAALAVFVVLSEACSTSPGAPDRLGTSRSAVLGFGSTWVPLGPDIITDGQGATNPVHVTGRVSVVAANPQNPTNDVWVGGATGGLWHGGPYPDAFVGPSAYYELNLAWEPMLDSLSPLSIGAIELAGCTPARCSTVWVGTGENSIRRDTYYGSGVAVGRWNSSTLKYDFTTRLGSTLFANGSITGLAVDPATSYPNETVYVALSSGEITSAADGTVRTSPAGSYGIYKSADSGQSWTLVLSQPGVKATDLEMDPTNAQTLYAGLQSAGFYKSTNGGASWFAINAGLDAALLTGGATPADWAELAVAPSQPTTLYAALAQCPHPNTLANTWWCKPAIYKSADGGGQWQLESAFQPASQWLLYGSKLTTYSMYEHKLVVHPTDPAQLWFTGIMLSYSKDWGAHWDTEGNLHYDHHDLSLFMTAGGLLAFDANDGGFFVGDGFQQWDDNAQYGLQITQLQSLATAPGKPGLLLIGTQDNGTNWRNGATWKHSDGGDSASAFFDVDDPNTAYDVYAKLTPRRCQNNLQCNFYWPYILTGLDASDPVAYYPPMQQGGVLPNQSGGTTNHSIFIASDKLYTSSNRGENWVKVGSLLPEERSLVYPDIDGKNAITALAVAPSNPQHAYVGYYNGEVWAVVGMDGSGTGTWTQVIAGGAQANPVSAIAVSSLLEDTVYVAYTGVTAGSIVWSSNGGLQWSDFSAGLGQTHVDSLAFLFDGGDYVFAGTDGGVFVRGPADGAMHGLASGLPAVPVFALVVDSNAGKLYAGTHGRGAWALDLNNTPDVIISHFDCLSCNFFGPDPVYGPVDLPLYGRMFPANQPSCSVTLYQQSFTGGMTACASGSTDGDGAAIRTDAHGRLVADKTGSYAGKPLVWGCLAGRCVGDVGQSQCMTAPVTQATIACGTMTGTVRIASPTARLDPPSAFLSIAPDMNAAHPPYTLALNARVRTDTGAVQTLCSVARTFTPGTTADGVLGALGQAVAADPTCVAAGVTAKVTTAGAGGGGGEDPATLRSALSLSAPGGFSAPGVFGRQLFPEVQGATYGLLQLDGMGLPLDEEIEPPMVTFAVPAGGAAGGSVGITETTSLGRCSYSVPTLAGDTAAAIANRAASLFDSASNDASCRGLQKARDLVVRTNPASGATYAVFSAADRVSVQSADPNVTATLGPSGW